MKRLNLAETRQEIICFVKNGQDISLVHFLFIFFSNNIHLIGMIFPFLSSTIDLINDIAFLSFYINILHSKP